VILNDFVSIDSVLRFLLILFRVAGMFMVAPMLGNKSVPSQVQVIFSVMLAIVLLPFVPFHNPLAIRSNLYLIQLIIQEVTIGVVIGFAAALIFSAVQVAGEIFGMKIGFSIAKIIDPSNQGSSGILTSLYTLFGGLLFLYLNGHHVIISALVDSFRYIPLGSSISFGVAPVLSSLVVKIFAIGIKISAPVIVVMTLLYLSFGFITKLSPQMNIYFNVGFILGPILGIFTLILSLPLFRVLMTNLTNDMGFDLIKVIRALKGT